MIKRVLGGVAAAAAFLTGFSSVAQAQVAKPAALKAVHVTNLHSGYEQALAHVKVGKMSGIVYARGHQPKAAQTSAATTTATTATSCAEPNCPLTYHGGPVQHHPRLYLLLWGPNWQTDASQAATASYLQSFYQTLGVQPQDNWSPITSQYGDSAGAAAFSGSQFAGVYNDTSTPPTGTTDSQLAAEADAFASANSLTTDPTDDQVIIATQSGTCPQYFYAPGCNNGSGYYCAYHDYSATSGVTFTNMPYLLDAGAACGEGVISNASINSTYEGFSIIGGHEYAESITDPQAGNGWVDLNDTVSGGEIGDKCAWVYPNTINSTNPVIDINPVTLANGITYAMQPLFSNSEYASGSQSCAMAASANYHPVTPVRVLDTRNGTGGYSSPVGPGKTIKLQVAGKHGVPAWGVTEVVLNVTAVKPTANGYVTVYPDGQPRPVASNLNFTKDEVIPNLVTVPVGQDGKVDFYNYSGYTNLIADLSGYYTNKGSLFNALGPARVLDTRNGIGGYTTPVGPGKTISLQVEGVNGVPATGVTAVVLNVTATNPTANSYVTVYPDGTTRPLASNLNFTKGETIPNLVVVPVGSDGKVDFYNYSGSVNLIADLSGYYTTSGAQLAGLGPVRMLDTRNGTGGYSSPVGPGKTISLQVTGKRGVPASGVTAVVLNVTAVSPTASSYITVYPDGTSRPLASNLNFTKGETIPNLVVVPVIDGKVDFYNNSGYVNLIADLSGYYTSG